MIHSHPIPLAEITPTQCLTLTTRQSEMLIRRKSIPAKYYINCTRILFHEKYTILEKFILTQLQYSTVIFRWVSFAHYNRILFISSVDCVFLKGRRPIWFSPANLLRTAFSETSILSSFSIVVDEPHSFNDFRGRCFGFSDQSFTDRFQWLFLIYFYSYATQ